MDEFEFYFSFYGLLLGLSVATVVMRFADVVGERRRRSIGWRAPLLGVFVLLDIASFWIFAWRAREGFAVTYAQVYFGLMVAATYFFSASLVFPSERSEWSSLDDHYASNKRLVLPGIMLANALVLGQAWKVRPHIFDFDFLLESLAYWLPLVALWFTRSKAVDIALLAWLCFYYVGGSLLLNW